MATIRLPSLLAIPELRTRIAVTLGALAVYRLGTYLPLAGIEPAKWARYAGVGLAPERLSVFALGLSPVITMLLLVEVARLASNRFDDWAGATPSNVRRLDWYVRIGSLLLAAMQSLAIAIGLEKTPDLVAEPGLQFRLGVVATLVTSTALLVWLADFISRHGIGSGIWVLLLAPLLRDLPASAAAFAELMRMGVLSMGELATVVGYVVIATAAVVALSSTPAGRALPLDRLLIWPILIAAIPGRLLLAILMLLPAGPVRDAIAPFLAPGTPLYLAVLALLVVAVSLLQWRRVKPLPFAGEPSAPLPGSAGVLPVRLTALALAAITVAVEILATRIRVSLPIGETGIIAAVVVALGLKAIAASRRT